MSRPRFHMDYLIYIEGKSFRNDQGDLFRGFTQDTRSLGSLHRRKMQPAFRFAQRLANRHGESVVVEQCFIGRRRGRKSRWSRWTCRIAPTVYQITLNFRAVGCDNVNFQIGMP